jgi:hypothetical protein
LLKGDWPRTIDEAEEQTGLPGIKSGKGNLHQDRKGSKV